jgi:hypothetical protein
MKFLLFEINKKLFKTNKKKKFIKLKKKQTIKNNIKNINYIIIK